MVGDMSRFTESGLDEELATETYEESTKITAQQLQSFLSGESVQESLPSVEVEVTFGQWQKIWDALNGNLPLAQLWLTVNGTPVVHGLATSLPGLKKPCQPQTLSGSAENV